MTLRYVSRPRALIEDREQQMQWIRTETPTVFEPEDNSRKTGLVDVRGNPIHAVIQMERIGFIPEREEE